MGVFSANTRNQVRNFFTGRWSESAASSGMQHGEEANSEHKVGLTLPESDFRPVSEFDGKMMEALFTEAGGGKGGGGDLELESEDRRNGGERSRNWGANYGAAASAVTTLDVRTLATRAVMAIGVASGDFSADGLFDEDNADGWSELLQGSGVAREGHGFEAGFSEETDGDWIAQLQTDQQFPNLRGHGLLPDLTDAVELNHGLRQQVADFVASGRGGTDAGFLAEVEREVTGILYGWAGLDGADAADGGADAMQAKFLDSYFGNPGSVEQAGIGIAEVLPPEAISEMFNEVRDTAILKLAGQGPMAGLFRGLAYDADADSLTGSAAMNRSALNAFGSSAATLGPEGEAGAWQALAALTHGFESIVGAAGALTTLFTAACGRSAQLASQVGEGMRTLGINPGNLKVKLPGLDDDSEEGKKGDDGEGDFESVDAGDAGLPSGDEVSVPDMAPETAPDWVAEQDATASTMDWNTYAARQTWDALPGGTTGGSTFGNLFDDYAVGASSQSPDYAQSSFSQQATDLFQMPRVTGFSIFDCFTQPDYVVA